MIYQLCNTNNEQIATFFKIAVIKKTALTAFTHLTLDDTIEDIITNIPDGASAFIVDLLPENLSLDAGTRTSDTGKTYTIRSRFVLTPQDKNLQELLEDYNNQEVVVLLDKQGSSFLYGTPQTPLLFVYDEIHSNQNEGLKGYEINLSGNCLGTVKQFESITFNIFSRGLAFQLAQTI